ncbi:transposase [Mycobacterium tuberculosis]|nr:transposase [Mycobacterium tuberculosis]
MVSISVKEYAVTSPKDLPYGEDRIMVRWNKIRWRCREDYCKLGPFTEAITQVPARVRSTLRLRRQMAKAIGDAARSVGRGRPADAVSWPTAHRAFVAYAETGIDRAVAHPGAGR